MHHDTARCGDSVNRSAQEHLGYIQEKVNPLLEALVTAVCLEQPEDPSLFMLRMLCEQSKSMDGPDHQGQGPSSTEEEIALVRSEIERLKERKAELLALRDGGSKDETKSEAYSSKCDMKSDKSTKADDESEEEDEDDAVDEMPPPTYNRGQRQSVSAEAYGLWNKKAALVAPVYEKTAEQKARIEKTLGPSFLFSSLEKDDMNTVILAFKEMKTEKGARIIQQGDDGESMFLIEEGQVDCMKIIDGAEKVVKKCGSGDVFGELALLYNCPRAASVVATEATILWELDRQTFNGIVKDAAAKKRECYTDFLKKVPLLRNMDSYEVMTIADALTVEIVEKVDENVIQQGDQGDKFFIVLEGEFVAKKAFVTGQTPQTVMTHKVGDYFGELSLLKNEPRAASVVSTEANGKLLSLERKTFKRLMGPVEDILRRQATRYDLPVVQ